MFRFRKPYLIQLYCFDKRGKLVHEPMTTIGIDKGAKSDNIVLILLITIFLLFFFARTLGSFLILLFSGMIIGVFALIKHYKERRNER